VTTASLPPLSALADAEEETRKAARAMLPLIAATLRVQYPTGAYLVVYRGSDDELRYDSVRDARGEIVFRFPRFWWTMGRFPQPVPADVAALWGEEDPTDPGSLLELLRHIDSHGALEFLPDHLMWPGEGDLDKTPLGVPLAVGGASC
jgi:hypothetical protein